MRLGPFHLAAAEVARGDLDDRAWIAVSALSADRSGGNWPTTRIHAVPRMEHGRSRALASASSSTTTIAAEDIGLTVLREVTVYREPFGA